MHYLSTHSEIVKAGVATGFFLWEQRICSMKYLEPELLYVISVFMKLGYRRIMLLSLKKKARDIAYRGEGTTSTDDTTGTRLFPTMTE